MKKIGIGSDHAGYDFKKTIIEQLFDLGYKVEDVGATSINSVDYPDHVHPLASKIDKGELPLGILICGTGNGVAMTANKYQNVRCGLCWNEEIAQLIRQHNNANILAIPARFINIDLTQKIVALFLNTKFEGGRHQRRINKITQRIIC
ncbi:MAG: ribose 5-phosphate isomerase B [Saprospiraceae bacterium]